MRRSTSLVKQAAALLDATAAFALAETMRGTADGYAATYDPPRVVGVPLAPSTLALLGDGVSAVPELGHLARHILVGSCRDRRRNRDAETDHARLVLTRVFGAPEHAADLAASDLRAGLEERLDAHLRAFTTRPLAYSDAGSRNLTVLREDIAQHPSSDLVIESAQHAVAMLSRLSHERVRMARSWAKALQRAFRARHRYLVAPDPLRRAIPVAFWELFVEPQIDRAPGGLRQLERDVERTVLLGHPGAGKSTVSLALALRLLDQGGPDRPFPLTTFIVQLSRHRSDAQPESLVQRIAADCELAYQCPTSAEDVEYALTCGLAVVIFDGLDEVLPANRRRETTADVLAFSARYPTTRVLVTSRVVGYSEAPLGDGWDIQQLQGFDESRVRAYVNAWMRTDPDRADPDARSDRLLSALNDLPDLTSSPLLLALLCSLSLHGRREIPRDRPGVYEECAALLLTAWDADRGIVYELPFRQHVRQLLDHLAYRIYSDASLASGVSLNALLRMSVSYLHPKRFADADEAWHAADEFAMYASSRMWVFTEVGRSAEGEPLYRFTHRTFLEYFAARYLARTAVTPEDFARTVLPHIARGELDVVSQIAVKQLDRDREGAGDDVLRSFLAQDAADPAGARILSFTARMLAFLVPSPEATSAISDRIVTRFSRSQMHPRDEVASVLSELIKAGPEVRPAVLSGAVRAYSSLAADAPAVSHGALAFVAYATAFSRLGYHPARPPEAVLTYWSDAAVATLRRLSEDALFETGGLGSVIAFMRAHESAPTPAPDAVFAYPALPLLATANRRISDQLLWQRPDNLVSFPRVAADNEPAARRAMFRGIATTWLSATRPWVTGLFRDGPRLAPAPSQAPELRDDSQAVLGALYLTLPHLEQRIRPQDRPKGLAAWLGACGTSPEIWHDGLTPEQVEFIDDWCSGKARVSIGA